MKRALLRHFWLGVMLIYAFLLNTYVTFAAPTITSPTLTYAETVGPGAANITEVVTVQCIATDTVTFDPIAPYVDLSPLGGLGIQVMTREGTSSLYRLTHTIPEGVQNNAGVFLTITARNANAQTTTANTLPIIVDNVLPSAPAGALFRKNGATSTGPIIPSNTFGFEITDENFQSTPSETTCKVNLSAVGLSSNYTVNYTGSGGVFRVDGIALSSNIDVTTDFTLTLTDPFTQKKEYKTPSIAFDTILPAFSAASVQVLSGNATARPGDVIRISATLSAADGDTLTASYSGTLNSTPALSPAANMVQSGGNWILDVTLSAQQLKSDALPIDIVARDNAGNTATRRVTVPIDLDPPSFSAPSVVIYSPDSATAYGTVASISDNLRFRANITNNIADTLTVTVDLTSIGGVASHPMPFLSSLGSVDTFEGWFQIPAGTLDNIPPGRTFTVTAFDEARNKVWEMTTPQIFIDNFRPSFSTRTLTRSGGGSNVKLGDQIVIACQLTNYDNTETAWVNLRRIGGLASATLNSFGSGYFAATFTVQAPATGYQPLDGSTGFSINVYDDVNNVIVADTGSLNFDNEIPVLASASWSVYPAITVAHPYVRVGDNLTLKVQLQLPVSGTRDGETVTANLSSAGGSTNQTLTYDGIATYTYTWKIATGTLNDGAVFPLTITDNLANSIIENLTISNFDNKPPDASTIDITGKNTSDLTTHVNIPDNLSFSIPITLEAIDDHGDCTIDLSRVGGSAQQLMTYSSSNYTFSCTAAATGENLEDNYYKFTAYIVDKAGNRKYVQTAQNPTDCWPPKLSNLTASIREATSIATIGRHIDFHVQTAEEDGGIPYINLSSFGLSATTNMTASSVANFWDYSLEIATSGGSVTAYASASVNWTVAIVDDAGNRASLTTGNISVDNTAPPAPSDFTVNPSDKIKLGDTVFLAFNSTGATSARVDMTAVGGSSAALMAVTAGGFSLAFVATANTTEYENYSFQAFVYDTNGNKVPILSNVISKIDCQPPVFGTSGITISQTNADNASTTVANINDVLTIYASMSYYADSTATATLKVSGSTVETLSLQYVAARNRHEATFTVPAAPGWGSFSEAAVTFTVSATDDVGNSATLNGTGAFTVDNTAPVMSGLQWIVFPDIASTTASGDKIINVGSDTTPDMLWAKASIDTNISEAYLNLSEFPGAPAKYSIAYTGKDASSTAGILLGNYGSVNWTQATFSITLKDLGGNQSTSSQSFYIDTKRPQISAATFDGNTLSVTFDEDIYSFDSSKFEVWGSTTAGISTFTPLGTITGLTYPATVFNFALTLSERKILAAWASQTLYLKAKEASAAKDRSGNWSYQYDRFPINITSFTWREPPRITSMTVTHTWPSSITIDLAFNKSVEPTTMNRSEGVLFVTPRDFDAVSYPYGYVFQSITADNATNNFIERFSWVGGENKQLHIEVSSGSAKWIAKKLANGAETLKFATRNSASIFIRDELDKPMSAVSAYSPLTATVTRPGNSAFYIKNSGGFEPRLDISGSTGTLVLNFTDEVLLYSNDFETISQDPPPRMGMPVPSYVNRATAFHGQIALYDLGVSPATSTSLTLRPLNITVNPSISKNIVTLELTTSDVQNILAIYRNNTTPTWRLKVESGSFINWWNQPSTQYESDPGKVTVVFPATTQQPSLSAIAISDPSPVKYYAAGNLFYEIELTPGALAGGWVPIASTTPKGILRKQDDTLLDTSTFLGWTSRQLSGEVFPRTIARFKTASDLPLNLEKIPAKISIEDVKDMFNNPMTTAVGSYVFDLSSRNNSVSTGFNTASAALVIDSDPPAVTSIATPASPIGQTGAGTMSFYVLFDEVMDTSTGLRPVLELATSGNSIAFNFAEWTNSSQTARFTNATAITNFTPSGFWKYKVSGGYDAAGNIMNPSESFTLEINSETPEPEIHILTKQSALTGNTIYTDIPFSSDIGVPSATVQITYFETTPQNQPYKLLVYSSTGTNIATFPLTNINVSSFPNNLAYWTTSTSPVSGSGPVTYQFKLRDNLGNISTSYLGSIVYDSKPSVVNSLTFNDSGRGIASAGIRYYAPAYGSATLTIQSDSTDSHRLVFASVPAAIPELFAMTSNNTTHQVIFGGSMAESVATITFADTAGNISTGSPASLSLKVDKTQPSVVTASPSLPIGVKEAFAGIFDITFSEPMQQGVIPAVTLEKSGTVIQMQAVTNPWKSLYTCRFTNLYPIKDLPIGTYTYFVSGARDYAGLDNLPSTKEVYVYSTNSSSTVTIFTKQPTISNSILVDTPFSTVVGDGSATIQLEFSPDILSAAPFSLIVCETGGAIVATLSVPAGNPTNVIFPGSSAVWKSGKFPASNTGPVNYSLKLYDSFGNLSTSLKTLVFDSKSPSISAFTISDGGGIATLSPDLSKTVRYHSPLLGKATVSLSTNASDSLRIVTGLPLRAATETFALSGGGGTTTYSGEIDTSSWTEASGSLKVADAAGNFAIGTASEVNIIIDRTSPAVSSVYPSLPIGKIGAGVGTFEFTFNERMNTQIKPTGELSSGSVIIHLVPVQPECWLNAYTCRMTNSEAISELPVSVYSYKITGGKDYAGNTNQACTQTITINSKTPIVQTRILTKQPNISTQVLENQPFSAAAGESSATVMIDFTPAPVLGTSYKLLAYDSENINVASFVVITTSPVRANFYINPSYWASGKMPGANTGPQTYSFRVIDGMNNLSDVAGTLVYDSKPALVNLITFNDNSRGMFVDGIHYYAPAYGSATVSFQTDATDNQWLIVSSSSSILPSVFSLTKNSTTHSTLIGGSLAECLATLSIVDMAGNTGSGTKPLYTVKVDRTSPSVNYASPTGTIGAALPGTRYFEFRFNEPMNTSVAPSVTLSSGSVSIRLQGTAPSCWISSYTCRLTNLDPIAELPVSYYTYQISNAKDYAGNLNLASNFKVYIYSKGTSANVSVLTRQPYISDQTFIDYPFSPDVGEAAASIQINYTGSSPLNHPYHLLVYNSAGANVATFAVNTDNPGISIFTNDPAYWSASNAPGSGAGPSTYQFKLRDALGNISVSYIGSIVYDTLPTVVNSLSFNDGNRGIASAGIRYYAPVLGSANIIVQTDSTDAHRMVFASATGVLPALFAMTANNTSHSLVFGENVGECVGTINFADKAGNISTSAAASLTLCVDRTPPRVSLASPSSAIGVREAMTCLFDITFSEPMQSAGIPTVTLERSGTVIRMQSVTNPWQTPYTCRFTNRDAIKNLPIGTYTYAVSGARDYAGLGNIQGSAELYIHSTTSSATITIYSKQPAITTETLTDTPFSTLVGNGKATLQLDFLPELLSAAPFKVVVCEQSGAGVATLSVPYSNPANVVFPGDSSDWESGKYPSGGAGPLNYYLKLYDNFGNLSGVLKTLVFDSKSPSVNAFSIADGGGIATLSPDLSKTVWYHSPLLGKAAISISTEDNDALRIVTGPPLRLSTETFILSGSETSSDYYADIDTASWDEAAGTLYVVDAAGNLAAGSKPVLNMLIDKTSPSVSTVSPSQPIGKLAAGAGIFEFTFNEKMNTQLKPTGEISSGEVKISLEPVQPECWITAYKCRMTNSEAINELPVSTYSYQISGAKDYAGNENLPCTKGVYVKSKSPDAALRVLTRQPGISTQLFENQPFSNAIGQSSATVMIEFSADTVLTPPYKLLAYDTSDVNVATFAVITTSPVRAIFSTSQTYWASGKVPAVKTGPVSYSLKILDGIGNLSSVLGTLVYDSKPSAVSSVIFNDGGKGQVLNGIRYYSPNFGSATIQIQTDQSEALRIICSTSTVVLPTVFQTSFDGILHHGLFGGSMQESVATITFADPAGNACTGAYATISIKIDRTPPAVVSISPSGVIGSIETEAGIFDITFSEKMQTSIIPAVSLRKDSTVIPLSPVASPWLSQTVCRFTNAQAIKDVPIGTYTYFVAGAKDLSGQDNIETNIQIFIQSNAQTPSFNILTKQPGLVSGILYNQPFSNTVGDGSATVSLSFDDSAQAVMPMNLQVFDESDSQVATLPIVWGTPAYSVFPSNSSKWVSSKYPLANNGPVVYKFKIIDKLGNISTNYAGQLTFDSRSAVVSSMSFDDSGRGSTVNGVKYYSPAAGSAILNYNSDSTDIQRLVLSSTTAMLPEILSMAADGYQHSYRFDGFVADSVATLSIADLAGNIAQNSTVSIVFDSSSPRVVSVNPDAEIVPYQAYTANFEITFSEAMKQSELPAVSLVNGQIAIPLVAAGLPADAWVSPNTVRLTNQYSLADFPQGKYSYIVKGGRDLAGNPAIETTSDEFGVNVNLTESEYNVVLRTRQQTISDVMLENKAFSPFVPPFTGSLSVKKLNSAPGIPSEIRLFDTQNNLIATSALLMSGNVGTATVDAAFFKNPGRKGPLYYNVKIADNLGGTGNFVKSVVYDAVEPVINSVSWNNLAAREGGSVWYNPQKKGDLTFSVNTSTADTLYATLATQNGTRSYQLSKPSYYYTGVIPASEFTGLSDSDYLISFTDDAGNMGTGSASTMRISVDRVAPSLVTFKSEPSSPLKANSAGSVLFTLTFNEKIDQAVNAAPALSLSSGTSIITCVISEWKSDREVVFVNESAIVGGIPQGNWDVNVQASDLAENRMSTTLPVAISIKSSGPGVSECYVESYQITTAESLYPQGIIRNVPFSMNVWPNASTLTINYNSVPVVPVYLYFMQNGFTVASYPISVVNGKSQFVWNSSKGPQPTVPTTYDLKLSDGIGNESFDICSWSIDSVAPVVGSVTSNGGVLYSGDGARYFNPAIHGNITCGWQISGEASAARMRLTGGNATLTYTLSGSGTSWSGTFNGKSSSGSVLPDGTYWLDSVDAAGNIGKTPANITSSITVVIDSVPPSIATITTKVGGEIRNRFAPSASPLVIQVDSSESLLPRNIWNLSIRTSSGNVVKTLRLVSSDNGGFGAEWNGTAEDGKAVSDGYYRIYASDITGNLNQQYAQVQVIKNDFKVLSVKQLSAKSLEFSFNYEIDPNSVYGAVITFDPQGPAVSNISMPETKKMKIELADSLTHGVSFKVLINQGTLYSVDGLTLQSGKNSGSFNSDSRGPVVSRVGFEGISNNKDFILYFDEPIDKATAEDTGNYSLTYSTKKVSLTRASLRSDNSSVLISASENLTDANTYKIVAIGIKDKLLNVSQGTSAEKTFKGLDLTPPVLDLNAFSNPGNETDLMIVVTSNEDLQAVPSVTIKQGGSSEMSVTMTAGSRPRYYMGGIHLSSSYSGTAQIKASGADVSGNAATAELDFSTAVVTASIKASLNSSDGFCSLNFESGSFSKNTIVTIIPQKLYYSVVSPGSSVPDSSKALDKVSSVSSNLLGVSKLSDSSSSLTYSASARSLKKALPLRRFLESEIKSGKFAPAKATLRAKPDKIASKIISKIVSASELETIEEVSAAVSVGELEICGKAYEISIGKANSLKDYSISISSSYAAAGCNNTGVFRLDGDSWKFVDSRLSGGKRSFSASSGGIYAVMRDTTPPAIIISNNLNDEPLSDSRPAICGNVGDFGSGLRPDSLKARLDGFDFTVSNVSSDGTFKFVPLNNLCGGRHEISFSATDNIGNKAVSPVMRFEIKTSLQISEISTFPNPAKEASTLRISCNRSDLGSAEAEVNIYDAAGHLVRTLDMISRSRENFAGTGRYIYDIRWDLRNDDGKKVANGIYFSKLKITDPDNPSSLIKRTQKIVILH
ncbi:MAG: hypothetical protein HQM10_08605 [Candidatus Riflebacteria bacterium]|nr:hypothetical protein [Candidatus Riflebacteria bacterium]